MIDIVWNCFILLYINVIKEEVGKGIPALFHYGRQGPLITMLFQ